MTRSIPRPPTDSDTRFIRIKYIPALVIFFMFFSVVLAVKALRNGTQPISISPGSESSPTTSHETWVADSLFDYAQSTVKPEALSQLRQYAAQTKLHAHANVIIVGHSDSLGDQQRNQLLSVARANAVRQTLINEGIEPTQIVAVGIGSEFPIKKREECPAGSVLTPSVIECMKPNRRVDLWLHDTAP